MFLGIRHFSLYVVFGVVMHDVLARDSAGTGGPGVSLLRLDEIAGPICSFSLSVTARKIVRADPSLRYTSTLLGR